MSSHKRPTPRADISAWFTGPNAENADQFGAIINRVFEDYQYWRRNYFPEDGVVIDSSDRRENEQFQDEFEDRLTELLARLKADFPFYSPRYAGHMMSEQTLPSIAGLFAGMLYNPNNVTAEAAPVTVALEHEVGQMIAKMLGAEHGSWAHICSGGTVANFEGLWIARTARVVPFLVRDIAGTLSVDDPLDGLNRDQLLNLNPTKALEALSQLHDSACSGGDDGAKRFLNAYRTSVFSPADAGITKAYAAAGIDAAILAPSTSHYSIAKALDVLGLGRRQLVSIPVDAESKMCPEALERALDRLDHEGRVPLAVVAVAGTTECGAIDPVDEVLRIRAEREANGKASFWVHADAAYGGYLRTMLIPTRMGLGDPHVDTMIDGRSVTLNLNLPNSSQCEALEKLGECDSITVDPHKLGFVPYPAGAVCFKSDLVKPVARQDAKYIAEEAKGGEADQKDDSIGMFILEGSKPGSAAASLWLSHKLIPLDSSGHGRLMQETVRNAAELYALLDEYPDLSPGQTVRAVPLSKPGSNIVCYAFKSTERKLSLAEINRLNRAIYDSFTIQNVGEHSIHERRFFASRTIIDAERFSPESAQDLLDRLGVTREEYEKEGVFLLRSVLMNPWYSRAKQRGRYFLAELTADLYRQAEELLS